MILKISSEIQYNNDDKSESYATCFSRFFQDVPWGMGDMLRWIQETFDDPPIRVTENGWADAGQLDDYGRINYHHGYLSSLLEAVKIDHCKVLSYTMWSFLDDFEWDGGYV